MNTEHNTTEFPASPQKILVIDDEENYREIISSTLQLSNYEVFEASNGFEGLTSVKNHRPDLILCDVNMPRMDGLALLTALKQEPEYAEIPFIFLTGNAGHSDMRKGMQLGADDYLTKPFTTEELLTAVHTRLTKKKSLQKYYESQFDDIKSNILQSLPHEFRTPLNSILGFSQMLNEEDDLPPEEVKEMGALIHKSGQRLHHLLENVVLFGQLQFLMNDREKMENIRRESETMVLEIIRSVTDKLKVIYERTDANIHTVNDATVQISSIYLTKIIEEIVDNAFKFSTKGTIVSISVEENDSSAIITVQDGGRGMSNEQLHRISAFQQFQRSYYEQQGAGLGLVLVRTLVELHLGSFSIESVEQKGTIITISLPKVTNQ